jgi:hypothetical protein
MKKNKIALGLVSSLVGVLALSACSSDVTSSKDNIVSFVGYDGSEIGIVTDEAYKEYLKTPSGISKFYEAIMESLIRYEFQTEGSSLYGKTKKGYEEIKQDATRKVESAKDEAKRTAKENGTTYDKEWESKLEGEGVEDEKELLEKYIYAGEKAEAEDWYFENNKEQLTKEYLGVLANGTSAGGDVSAMFPYHIRHILVKVAGGASEFARGAITRDESLNLATVINALRDGNLDFGTIAQTYSEDTGSAAKYGDVGIMTTETSFVNEFKLGIYAYDAALSGKTNTVINEGLGLNGAYENSTVLAKIKSIGLAEVPAGVFARIDEYKDTITSDAGLKVNNGNESYYPRNILWNRYVNYHNPFVITNETFSTALDALDTNGNYKVVVDNKISEAATGKCGFRTIANVASGKKVLTDEKGNPIIGVRSEHGIHLMIMEKSIFDYNDTVSLQNYYTTLTPNDDGYPVDKDVQTYVTYIKTADQSTLNERAEEIENAIKTFDSTYNYRLFEYFVDSAELQFLGEDGIYAKAQIEAYIEATRNTNNYEDAKTLNKAWRTYLELIDQQTYERERVNNLIPDMCAIGFKKAHKADGSRNGEFVEGGKCYYAN